MYVFRQTFRYLELVFSPVLSAVLLAVLSFVCLSMTMLCVSYLHLLILLIVFIDLLWHFMNLYCVDCYVHELSLTNILTFRLLRINCLCHLAYFFIFNAIFYCYVTAVLRARLGDLLYNIPVYLKSTTDTFWHVFGWRGFCYHTAELGGWRGYMCVTLPSWVGRAGRSRGLSRGSLPVRNTGETGAGAASPVLALCGTPGEQRAARPTAESAEALNLQTLHILVIYLMCPMCIYSIESSQTFDCSCVWIFQKMPHVKQHNRHMAC